MKKYKIILEEMKPFLNGVNVNNGDLFTIEDLIAIALNMKRLDRDYYEHCVLGIIHDETNGNPELMELLLNKAIAEGILPNIKKKWRDKI